MASSIANSITVKEITFQHLKEKQLGNTVASSSGLWQHIWLLMSCNESVTFPRRNEGNPAEGGTKLP